MVLLTRQRRVAVGKEATLGVLPTLTSYEAEIEPLAIEVSKEPRSGDVTADHLPAQGFSAAQKAMVDFSVPLYVVQAVRETGDPSITAIHDAALQGCGLTRTNGGSDNVRYTLMPNTYASPHSTASVRAHDGNRSLLLSAARGSVDINIAAAKEVRAKFHFEGRLSDSLVGNTANAIGAPVIPVVKPVLGKQASFSLYPLNSDGTDGTKVDIGSEVLSMDFTLGNEITRVSSVSFADGYGDAVITGSAPTVSLQYTVKPPSTGATQPTIGALIGDGVYRLSVVMASPTTGVSIELSTGALQITGVSGGDDGGLETETFTASVITDVTTGTVAPFLSYSTPSP